MRLKKGIVLGLNMFFPSACSARGGRPPENHRRCTKAPSPKQRNMVSCSVCEALASSASSLLNWMFELPLNCSVAHFFLRRCIFNSLLATRTSFQLHCFRFHEGRVHRPYPTRRLLKLCLCALLECLLFPTCKQQRLMKHATNTQRRTRSMPYVMSVVANYVAATRFSS